MSAVLVIVMEPGEAPDLREVAEDKILGLLGGYHQVLGQSLLPTISGVTAVVRQFDWEGQAEKEGVAANFSIHGHLYHGPPVVMASDSDGNTVSLNADQAQTTLGRIARNLARVGAQS